ncbi:hypothetical protein [Methylobacterium nigriterrae]|uniref:hypothetical protein n=1 Tax=Methylobacterium nigriterrae TaxID=3127512 RepID=UPI003013C0D1
MIGRARLPLPIIDQLSSARRGWHDQVDIGLRANAVRALAHIAAEGEGGGTGPTALSDWRVYRQRAFTGRLSLALGRVFATAACVRAVDEHGGKGEDGGTKPTVVASRKKQISPAVEALGRTDPPFSQPACCHRLK